jgi:hypothetical protein
MNENFIFLLFRSAAGSSAQNEKGSSPAASKTTGAAICSIRCGRSAQFRRRINLLSYGRSLIRPSSSHLTT